MSIEQIFELCKAMNPGDAQDFTLDHKATLADAQDLRNRLEQEYEAGERGKWFTVVFKKTGLYVWCMEPITDVR